MAETQIRFDDGAGYEEMMGKWSRLAGDVFLDWVAPPGGLRWVDVGCGNGAFTQLLVDRCEPASVQGIDPSEGQLAFARTRPASRLAVFEQGDAMALPYADASFDAAVMALVIFFVPQPPRGVAEMVRVTRPGGIVAAYAWDILGGGFPLDALQQEMRASGLVPMLPPSVEASRMPALQQLWNEAGLDAVETREITVQRAFESFEDYWRTSQKGSCVSSTLGSLPGAERDALKDRVRARLQPAADGRIVVSARANAIKGRVTS